MCNSLPNNRAMQNLTIPASVSKRKQACKSCRQRKKKCDAERPSCGLCKKWGTACEYAIPATTQAEVGATNWNIPESLLPLQTGSRTTLQQSGPFNIQHFPGMHFNGSGIEPETILSIDGVLPMPDSSLYPEETLDQQEFIFDFQLPPHQLLVELVELFFDKVYHMFPIFHRKKFQMQVGNGFLQTNSPLILYAMCSVAAPYHPDATVRKRQKDWYEQAKFSYELTKRAPHPGLRTIQAALLLIFNSFTSGDFSASYLFIAKAWRQAVALNLNSMDVRTLKKSCYIEKVHGQEKNEMRTGVQKEEYRRTLWLLFVLDKNQSWPSNWPPAVSELIFKIDLPIADSLFQAMDPGLGDSPYENTPFTRNLHYLIESCSSARIELNTFYYICIAHVLLGRISELIFSLHEGPDAPESAGEYETLNSHLIKFQLSLPRQATSVLEAPPPERGHAVWLQIILNICSILLNFRPVGKVANILESTQFVLAITAARNMAQVIKDASRISIDLLMSAHIGSSLYAGACVNIVHGRLTSDPSLREELALFQLVFERMNDIFVFLGLKFKLAIQYDLEMNKENLELLTSRGFQGFLTDYPKWAYVREEVERRGIPIDIS